MNVVPLYRFIPRKPVASWNTSNMLIFTLFWSQVGLITTSSVKSRLLVMLGAMRYGGIIVISSYPKAQWDLRQMAAKARLLLVTVIRDPGIYSDYGLKKCGTCCGTFARYLVYIGYSVITVFAGRVFSWYRMFYVIPIPKLVFAGSSPVTRSIKVKVRAVCALTFLFRGIAAGHLAGHLFQLCRFI